MEVREVGWKRNGIERKIKAVMIYREKKKREKVEETMEKGKIIFQYK